MKIVRTQRMRLCMYTNRLLLVKQTELMKLISLDQRLSKRTVSSCLECSNKQSHVESTLS